MSTTTATTAHTGPADVLGLQLPCPSSFVLCTSPSGATDADNEEDRSMVYAFTGRGDAAMLKTFKGLSLAIRGVLDSVCGEKTTAIRLQHTQGDLVLAFAHLQAFMVVLALPGSVTDALAADLTVLSAQTALLLLGPCICWCQNSLTPQGSLGALVLKPEASAALDKVFEGVFKQLSGTGWQRVLPALMFKSTVLHMAVPQPVNLRLQALLQRASCSSSTVHSPRPQQPIYNFYRKRFCLMYRGLLLSGNLGAQRTRQLWQMCWALQLFQQAAGLPCTVLTHKVHMDTPADASSTAQGTAGGHVPASGPAGGAPGGNAAAANGGGGFGATNSPNVVVEEPQGQSLLVLVSACNLILAVVLAAYDEDVEEEVVGKLEGQAGVELLHRIHSSLGAELEALVDSAVAYRTIVKEPQDSSAAGAALPNTNSLPPRPSRAMAGASGSSSQRHQQQQRGSLLMRLMNKKAATPPPIKLPSRTFSDAAEGPEESDVAGRFHSNSPTGSGVASNAQAAPLLQTSAAASIAANSTDASDISLAIAAPGAPSPHLPPSPRRAEQQAPPVPAGAMFVLASEPASGRLLGYGDAPASLLPHVWQAVVQCKLRLGSHNVPVVAPPPKHARLCMTLEQISQLAAARSQREGGERLGTADSSPWQYHPELSSLAEVQQVTVKLPPAAVAASGGAVASLAPSPAGAMQRPAAAPGPPPAVYLTGCLVPDGREFFILHGDDADEGKILEELLLNSAAMA